MFFSAAAVVPFILMSLVKADPVPTEPDSSTIAIVGQSVTTQWTADTTGTWTKMTIQLMTGANLAMVALETLATDIDATTTTSYTFTTPDVSPYSQIYFLQFTNPSNATAETWWTTRFAIEASGSSLVTPTNVTGTVSWGTGQILSAYSNSTASITAAVTSTSAPATTTSSSESSSSFSSAASASASAAISSVAIGNTVAQAAASASTKASSGTRVVVGSLVSLLVGGAFMLVL